MAVPFSVAFSTTLFLFQFILIVVYVFFVDYADYKHPSYIQWTAGNDANSTPYYYSYYNDKENGSSSYYSFFQDVHVMIFIGFGFLMTFLKKYSFGAVGYNLFIAALVIQWSTLVNGWLFNVIEGVDEPMKIKVDLKSLITSDFASAAVLITFGAVLGKTSRLQLFTIGVLEILFYAVNETILVHYLKITDVGGSMVIHMFGAYFGLAVARMLHNESEDENDKEGSVYHSDVFAMIGTIFLWMFWPSFNAAMLGPGPQQHRAVINTYYSLAACCIITFVVSPTVNKQHKIDMVHIQNATLAGGVAVGTCADLMIKPWGAMLIGTTAGVISTLGYAYVTSFLNSKLKVHDTCGVHNLHGMPAILAAIAGAITAAFASEKSYGNELYNIWSARIPKYNTTGYIATMPKNGIGRSAGEQAGYQIVAMVVTLAISVIGGLFTGLIIRCLDNPTSSQRFDDKDFWIVEDSNETNNDKSFLLKDKASEEEV